MKGKKAQMRKPRKVSIAGTEYEILWMREVTEENLYGNMSEHRRRIKISTQFPLNTQKETLLHELLHICFLECLIMDDRKKLPLKDLEEGIIRWISPRIFQMFRDNPRLTQFLFTKE